MCYGTRRKFSIMKIDEFVKSRNSIEYVIPAKAGIQLFHGVLDPGFRRGDDPKEVTLSFRRTPDRVRGRRRNPAFSDSYKFSGLRFPDLGIPGQASPECGLFTRSSIVTEFLHYLPCIFAINDYYIFVSRCGYAIWVARSEAIFNGC